MKRFVHLYTELDETNKTLGKVEAMVRYFKEAPPEDAIWGLYFLSGRRPKRPVSAPKIWGWANELSGLPAWLFSECYDAVGDMAETIATILPDYASDGFEDVPLHKWIEDRLLYMQGLDELSQREIVERSWRELDRSGRLVWNKLITGAFRVGVSQDLVIRALSQASGIPAPTIAHRLMGQWEPTALFFESLMCEDGGEANVSRPYPFCLAHPLVGDVSELGAIEDWRAEWKWDGIRCQLVRREGQTFVWSRGEELISERFPEIKDLGDVMPNGTVLDGEIMAWRGDKPLLFAELQKRIGRKIVGKKLLADVPVVLVAFDLLEWAGEDIRKRAYSERREILELLVSELRGKKAANPRLSRFADSPTSPSGRGRGLDGDAQLEAYEGNHDSALASRVESSPTGGDPESPPLLLQGRRGGPSGSPSPAPNLSIREEGRGQGGEVTNAPAIRLSQQVVASSWQELAAKRQLARENNVEGLMLKKADSPYVVGRKKGYWWKWKIEPFTVDAVLIYAARGSGIRASLYTDYTFGIWRDGELVPFAKAYSGLNDEEIRQVDAFVRRSTLEKFGPVRTVKPELVFELAFEGIQLSNRHKSGIAVRFPRIARWRHDKKPEDADSIETVRELLAK
ncbi:MAG TPA: ATP-dependent DNA ligase [Fimbriimonadaceae bacterium]|jgi:DNA ligase-1